MLFDRSEIAAKHWTFFGRIPWRSDESLLTSKLASSECIGIDSSNLNLPQLYEPNFLKQLQIPPSALQLKLPNTSDLCTPSRRWDINFLSIHYVPSKTRMTGIFCRCLELQNALKSQFRSYERISLIRSHLKQPWRGKSTQPSFACEGLLLTV